MATETDLQRKNRLCREASEFLEVGNYVEARKKLEAALAALQTIPTSIRRRDTETRFDKDWISAQIERCLKHRSAGRSIGYVHIRRTRQ